jgi:3-hydroxyisobutyrate dehydrogenase
VAVAVGFVGLGMQGGPMAARIATAGNPLHVWSRRAETVEGFAGPLAGVASTPRELGARCEVVCVCVRADTDVEGVCRGEDGLLAGMASGSVLVVHSTVHPSTVVALAADAATRGVAVLDAPVSGGGAAAAAGRLATIVGGDAEVLERVRPVLATHSDRILHVGGVGAAQLAKLVNNAVFTAQLALGTDALRMGEALGLDRAVLHEVLRAGSGRSYAMDAILGFGDDLPNSFGGQLLVKDVSILAALAAEVGVQTGPVLATAAHALRLEE